MEIVIKARGPVKVYSGSLITKRQGPKRKWPSTLFIFFARPEKTGCPTMHRH